MSQKKKKNSRGAEKATAPTPAKQPTVLVLRTCDENLKAYNGFQWPASGLIAAPDWRSDAECGHGLHGLLWGEGDGSLLNWDAKAKWLVVEVEESSIVDLAGKVKFPRGVVVHCGDRKSATDYIAANGGGAKKITGATTSAGYMGTATAGDMGTASACQRGTEHATDMAT